MIDTTYFFLRIRSNIHSSQFITLQMETIKLQHTGFSPKGFRMALCPSTLVLNLSTFNLSTFYTQKCLCYAKYAILMVCSILTCVSEAHCGSHVQNKRENGSFPRTSSISSEYGFLPQNMDITKCTFQFPDSILQRYLGLFL